MEHSLPKRRSFLSNVALYTTYPTIALLKEFQDFKVQFQTPLSVHQRINAKNMGVKNTFIRSLIVLRSEYLNAQDATIVLSLGRK